MLRAYRVRIYLPLLLSKLSNGNTCSCYHKTPSDEHELGCGRFALLFLLNLFITLDEKNALLLISDLNNLLITHI